MSLRECGTETACLIHKWFVHMGPTYRTHLFSLAIYYTFLQNRHRKRLFCSNTLQIRCWNYVFCYCIIRFFSSIRCWTHLLYYNAWLFSLVQRWSLETILLSSVTAVFARDGSVELVWDYRDTVDLNMYLFIPHTSFYLYLLCIGL